MTTSKWLYVAAFMMQPPNDHVLTFEHAFVWADTEELAYREGHRSSASKCTVDGAVFYNDYVVELERLDI